MVGSDGAELFYYGCTVSIPSGALEEATEISLEFISSNLQVVSPVLKLEPQNLNFIHPVTVSLPVAVYPSPTIPEAEWPELILMQCHENGKWSYKQSTKFKFRDLKFECNHFSSYCLMIDASCKKWERKLACSLYESVPKGQQAEVTVSICDGLALVCGVSIMSLLYKLYI